MKLRTSKAALAAVLSAALLASSCRAGFLFDLWDDFLTLFLDISPMEVVLEQNQSVTLKAKGGHSPYIFTKTGGSGTLTDNLDGTATYTAPVFRHGCLDTADRFPRRGGPGERPGERGPDRIAPHRADERGARVGGSIDFDAAGGFGTYVFSLVSGLGSVDPDTGVYTAPSQDTDAVVQVEDDTGQAALAAVTVRAAAQPLAIAARHSHDRGGGYLSVRRYGRFAAVYLRRSGGSISAARLLHGPRRAGHGDDHRHRFRPACPGVGLRLRGGGSCLRTAPDHHSALHQRHPGCDLPVRRGGGKRPVFLHDGHRLRGYVTPSGLYTAPTSEQGVEYVIVPDGRGITDTATVKVRKK